MKTIDSPSVHDMLTAHDAAPVQSVSSIVLYEMSINIDTRKQLLTITNPDAVRSLMATGTPFEVIESTIVEDLHKYLSRQELGIHSATDISDFWRIQIPNV